MRELALVTVKIVDGKSRLYPEEVHGWYASDGGKPSYAEDQMELLEPPVRGGRTHPGVFVNVDQIEQTSDATEPQYQPRERIVLLRLDVCNPDSSLGYLASEVDEMTVLKSCFAKLERAGVKLLEAENRSRSGINDMSKLLSGDGVEQLDEIQFYAVFRVYSEVYAQEELNCYLEGVLRLDKIDMAIDEAILL